MEIANSNVKTMAGKPVDKIAELLAEIFVDADKAYKQVPGGADLTDINTGHMIERVTQVFGVKGLGWNFRWDPADLVFIGDVANPSARIIAHLKNAVFSYALVDDKGESHWIDIQTSGMNANAALYVEEGARTTALGAALKGLCFQLPIYKGYLDHHNAAAVATAVVARRNQDTQRTAEQPQAEKPIAKPAAVENPAAVAAPTSPAASTTEAKASAFPADAAAETAFDPIPEKLPDGVNPIEYIDGLADRINLNEFKLPPGSNAGGQLLSAQSDARLKWYAYSMRPSNPRAMVIKMLAYRLMKQKGLLQPSDKHPLAS